MKLPQPYDYQMALQAPTVAFLDGELRRGNPRRNPLGLPATVSGGFALTFDLTVDRTRYAVRCFHKQGNHLQERYAAVADFIHTVRLGFLVDVDYLHSGIRVGDNVFPVVRMPWVDGSRLDDWIDDNLFKPAALDRVRRNVATAVTALREHGAAHGDLQHGNILVRSDGSIQLVDYDGMYLPALRPYGAAERGHRNYQHPERSTQYDPSLDLFAASVIDLSLAALIREPQLWKELNKNSGEALLFSAEDFADPANSPVFARLGQTTELAEQVRRLRHACEVGFDVVPDALAGAVSTAAMPRRSGTQQAAPAPTVIRATDRSGLLARQGDEITVVGRIGGTKTIRRIGTITFINFGDYRRGAFTVVAWDRAHRDLLTTFGDPAELTGSWVSVTGLLSVYQNPKSATITPQIELRSARSISTITAAQAAAMLAPTTRRNPTPSRPATATTASRTPPASPSQPTSAAPAGTSATSSDLDDLLGRLYSSPTFTARISNTGSTSTTPPGPPGPSPTTPPPRPSPPRRPVPPRNSPAAPPRPGPTTRPSPPPRPAQQYPPTTRPYRTGSPTSGPPPPYQTPRAAKPTPDAGATLLAAIFLGPIGFALALTILVQQPRRSDSDRSYAWISIIVAAFWTMLSCCLLPAIVGS